MTVMGFGLPGHHESSIEDEGRLAVEAFGPPGSISGSQRPVQPAEGSSLSGALLTRRH